MKKRAFAFVLAAILLLLTACGSDPKPSDSGNTFQVIEVRENGLLVTGSNSAFDLFTVGTEDTRITDEKDREITLADLRPGMILEFEGRSSVAETYPGRFDVNSVHVLKQEDDLVGLYRSVLRELWETDPALNENITTIGMDISGLTNLSDVERNALEYVFGNDVCGKTGQFVNVVTGTWQELCSEGYIDTENLYWEDGVFFSLSVTDEGNGKFAFKAEKWRSGTGAIYFKSCTAKRGADGVWSYDMGSFAIA